MSAGLIRLPRWWRSAGVAVTFPVHRRIAAGNRARDAGDWPRARDAYAAAVARDPGLAHIWLQLGHAEKETGDLAAAEAAYAQAAVLRPGDAEPPLHRGHAAKLAGDPAAFGHYLDAMTRAPAVTTLGELGRLMMAAPRPERDSLAAAFRRRLAVVEDAPDAADAADLFLDVSDLVAYFSHGRLPTGIQRIQIEVAAAALSAGDRTVAVAVFTGEDGWARLPAPVFADLAALAVAGGGTAEPAWLDALARLFAALAEAPPLAFPPAACLVNLGTSWGLPNYFLHLRGAKRRHGIRYVPMVYDLIPLLRPDWFERRLVADFTTWAEGVFAHADGFLAGSQATRADLIAQGARAGAPLAPERVVAVALDGDFRRDATPEPGFLVRHGLEPGGFVLLVSTLEPRKGHVVAFDAWSRLLAEEDLNDPPPLRSSRAKALSSDVETSRDVLLGRTFERVSTSLDTNGEGGGERATIPKLVCVGGKGWLNEPIHARLAADPTLAAHVLLLSGIGDAELALLYRACRFTLYPSLYEGWGLPVTEALSWGKVPIVSAVASLPEAGGDYAVYVPPGDADALAAAARRLIDDDAALAAREARIAAFRPRPWAEVAAGIVAAARALAEGTPSPPLAHAPPLLAGRTYAFGRERAADALPGEALRAGPGWAAPDLALCRTKAGGGDIALALSGGGPWAVTLRLVGLPDMPCIWRLAADGVAAAGVLAPGDAAEAAVVVAGPDARLTLTGAPAATLPRADRAPADTAVSVGLAALTVNRPRGR